MHRGQARAWHSDRRFIAVLAGTQSGKTSWGPLWLKREIDRCGAGDYLAVTASYDLFKLKLLPAIRETFEHVYGIGRYWSGDRVIELRGPDGRFKAQRADDPMWGRIILRSAESPAGLESSTAKAAWIDEAGQDNFTVAVWEAVMRRLALMMGRCLLTTTIYNLGWLKKKLYDPWIRAGGRHAEIDVVQFDSIENPAFPQAEYERARLDLPAWKFDMFYRGRYTQPAGLIYDCFDSQTHVVPRFEVPDKWRRLLGLDFGGVNTAGVFFAQELDGKKLFAYREYKAGGRTAREHAAALKQGEPRVPTAVGGSHSEGQWRSEFAAAGLPVQEPAVRDVEVGIQRVYGAIKRGELFVMDHLTGLLDELATYSRVTNSQGEIGTEIDDKSSYHHLDAVRYVVGWARRGGIGFTISTPNQGRGNTAAAQAPKGVFLE